MTAGSRGGSDNAKRAKNSRGDSESRERKDDAPSFYKECLEALNDSNLPFMVGGTFAVNAWTGMQRTTKDLDIFVKAGDYPRVISALGDKGFKTAVYDERWLAKISRGRYYLDVIFNAGNSIVPVTEDWFKNQRKMKVLEVEVPVLPLPELVWAKMFGMDRLKYEGNDIAHLFLRRGRELDWRRLLGYADQYWEVLLMHIINFRFIYPSERETVPRWLFDELLSRLDSQTEMPTSRVNICRGRLLSRGDFSVDVNEWGFADVVGSENEKLQ